MSAVVKSARPSKASSSFFCEHFLLQYPWDVKLYKYVYIMPISALNDGNATIFYNWFGGRYTTHVGAFLYAWTMFFLLLGIKFNFPKFGYFIYNIIEWLIYLWLLSINLNKDVWENGMEKFAFILNFVDKIDILKSIHEKVFFILAIYYLVLSCSEIYYFLHWFLCTEITKKLMFNLKMLIFYSFYKLFKKKSCNIFIFTNRIFHVGWTSL